MKSSKINISFADFPLLLSLKKIRIQLSITIRYNLYFHLNINRICQRLISVYYLMCCAAVALGSLDNMTVKKFAFVEIFLFMLWLLHRLRLRENTHNNNNGIYSGSYSSENSKLRKSAVSSWFKTSKCHLNIVPEVSQI